MLHILLVDDCYPINTRNQKIINSLKKNYGDKVKLTVVAWDRNNGYTEAQPGYMVYKKTSAYGHKTRKLMNLWGYRQFCRATIQQQRPDVVIASHWNNLLMVPQLDRSRQMLIYENLDVPTEAYVFRKASSILEHLKMRQADLTIHASRFFPKLYPASCNQLVLENKPTFQAPKPQPYAPHKPLRIAFIGLLRYRDILGTLIDAVRNDERFELYFHGDGHAKEFLEAHASQASNVFFTGRYAYNDVARLYEQTDVVWAAYPNKDFNVKYAISNKFHESLTFGIPTVYANETCLGDFVTEHHIGMAVDPYSSEAIKLLLEKIIDHRNELQQMADNMRAFGKSQTSWDEDFRQVTKQIDTFFEK